MEENKKFRRPQKTIRQLRKFSEGTDYYWLLFNYGKMYFNKTDGIYYREVDFIKSSKNGYFANNDRVVRVCIQEKKTMLFNLGTIFNFKGYPINSLSSIQGKLEQRSIVISNKNFTNIKYDKEFENTFYPKINQDNLETNLKENYYSYPYHIKNYIDEDNEIITQYIIPNDLIRKKFYYKSYSGINSIIKLNNLNKGIVKKEWIDNEIFLFYNSNHILKKDLESIAKYYFTIEGFKGNQKTGFDRLIRKINEFHAIILQSKTINSNQIYGDIEYLFPFSNALKLEVLGQWITKKGSKIRKFLAYKIISFENYIPEEAKKEVSNAKIFFTTTRLNAIDINDKTSTDKKGEKEIKNGEMGLINQEEIKYDSINDTNITNSSLGQVVDEFYTDNDDSDEFCLEIDFIKREDQKFSYLTQKIPKILSGLSSNLENTSSTANDQQNNVTIYDHVNSFSIFKEALEKLHKTHKLNYQYITINDSLNYPYSDASYFIKKGQYTKIVDMLLIVKIVYKDREFCVIEANKGTNIGLFENMNSPLEDKNDERLTDFLLFIMKEYKYRWSSFYFKKGQNEIGKVKEERFTLILEKYKYKVLKPIDHLSQYSKNVIIEKLADNIYNTIRKSILK